MLKDVTVIGQVTSIKENVFMRHIKQYLINLV